MIERYEDVPIADLVIDRFQVRKSNTGEKIDELVKSIESFGLLHPIVVSRSERDPRKWEVVCGQRRLLAHKKLGKDTIKAGVIDRILSEDEGIAISGNENIHQLDMTRTDLVDLCEKLYLRYGTIRAVWEKTRMPYDIVQKYVRYSRLETNLKTLVDSDALPVDLAIKAQDAATVDGRYDAERAEELVKVLRESDDELRKRILEVNAANPTSEIDKIVDSAKKPDERLKISFTMGAAHGRALRRYAEDQDAEPSVAAQDMIESALMELGFVEE